MKRLLMMLAVFAMLLSLCSPAFATIISEDDGIYAVSGEATLKNFRTADGTVAIGSAVTGESTAFYADACHFTVECGNVTDGKQYILYLLTEQAAPTVNNLAYIDQRAAAGGKVTFDNVYPNSLQNGVYYIYVTGEGRTMDAPVATFQYCRLPRFTLHISTPAMGVESATVKRGITDLGIGTMWEDVKAGTFSISAAGLVPRTEYLRAEDGGELTITLAASGDLNGSGKLDVIDMQCLYTYLSTNQRESALGASPDYFDDVADANGDSNVNILDYQRIYEQIQAAGSK